MKKSLGLTLFLLYIFFIVATVSPVVASPFMDINDTHWAAEGVRQLADKGLLEGPDGKHFYGDRSMTRYEMAKLVNKMLARIEETAKHEHIHYADKEDLTLIHRLATELKDNIDSTKKQAEQLEKEMEKLEKRITNREQVRWYLNVDAIANTQSINKRGTNFQQAFDFTNGRPLAPTDSNNNTNNNFATALATFGIEAELSPDFKGGLELSSYGITGLTTPGLAPSYWGVSAPYTNNWWTGQTVSNNFSLEKAWIEHRQSEIELTYGAFYPKKIGGHILKGEPNPSFYGSEYLPMYGFTANGPLDYMHLPFVTWEVVYTQLASQASYYTSLAGANIGVDLSWANFNIGYTNAQNESTTGSLFPVLTPFSNPFNLIDPTGGQYLNTGVQGMQTFGVKIEPRILKNHNITLEYATSRYEPDKTNFFTISPRQSGNLINISAEGPLFGGHYGVSYTSVDPDYDPFILGYPGNAIVRHWAIWNNISNFYFMHDTVNYPHNREGFRLNYNHEIPWGSVSIFGSLVAQKHSSNDLFNNYPVHIEPTFGGSPNFGITTPYPFLSNNKGHINSYGVQFALAPIKKLKTGIVYSHTDLYRAEDGGITNNTLANGQDNWASRSNNFSLNLDYALSSSLSAQADFARIDFGGTTNGFGGYAINQNQYGIGLSYAITNNAALALGYRHYVTSEYTPNRTSYASSSQGVSYGDSNAQMLLARLKMNF